MKRDKKIRVLLVEDHPVVRAGIRSALAACERLRVVGEAETGEKAVLTARKLLPDVMVIDIELPGMDGLDVADLMRDELPGIKIILLSMHENARYIERATHSGVCGYLLKNMPLKKLVEGVVAVGLSEDYAEAAGKGAAGTTVGAMWAKAARPAHLTECEESILALIAIGKTSQEIADALGIRLVSVYGGREIIKRKLNIRTIAGLTKYAMAHEPSGKPCTEDGVE